MKEEIMYTVWHSTDQHVCLYMFYVLQYITKLKNSSVWVWEYIQFKFFVIPTCQKGQQYKIVMIVIWQSTCMKKTL